MAENIFSLPTNKVLSLGIAVADTFAKPINKFPKWNTLDTFSEIKFSAGGCAVNTGINLKNLGLDVGVAAAIVIPIVIGCYRFWIHVIYCHWRCRCHCHSHCHCQGYI